MEQYGKREEETMLFEQGVQSRSEAPQRQGGQNYTAVVHLQVLLHSYTISQRHLIMHIIFTVDYSMH